MTIYEVAEKAGVSIATVSRALNPETRAKVAPETLQRIESLVGRTGYTPSLAAKHLSRASYQTIGLLFPHHQGIFFEDYYCKILSGVSDALLGSRYHLKLMMQKCDGPRWEKHNFRSAEGIDGLIVTHWHAFFPEQPIDLGLPTAVIGDCKKDPKVHCVTGDHAEGGRLAAEHLFKQGHRRIGILTGSPDSKDSHDRVRGFREFLSTRGIEVEDRAVACGHFQEQTAYDLADEYLARNRGLTAVFCCNDNMAFGLLRRASELGILCPDELSVVGYDNDKKGEYGPVPLTTVDVPIYDLANEAVMRLVGFLDAPKNKQSGFYHEQTVMPVRLMERKSVSKRSPEAP